MKHANFNIGLEFHCGGRRRRCTDIGTRMIVAIDLGPKEIVEVTVSSEGVCHERRRIVSGDQSWFAGPPYAVAAVVFDEDDVAACTAARI